MRYIISLFSLLILLPCHAQNKLLEFSGILLCDSVEINKKKVKPHTHVMEIQGDTLLLKVRLLSSCDIEEKIGAIKYENDSLNLAFTSYNQKLKDEDYVYEEGIVFNENIIGGSMTRCYCYVELEYKITGIHDLSYISIFSDPVIMTYVIKNI